MKKAFIVVTFVLGVALVAMLLTKPEPKEHYDAMIGLAQNVVDQEMTSIEGVDAATLEKLGADVDLTEVTELGKDMAMNTAGFYLQSHMKVHDYHVATIGMLNYKGTNLPVTIGVMGKVFVLVDEGQARQMLRQ